MYENYERGKILVTFKNKRNSSCNSNRKTKNYAKACIFSNGVHKISIKHETNTLLSCRALSRDSSIEATFVFSVRFRMHFHCA